jgi:hypothetical protein
MSPSKDDHPKIAIKGFSLSSKSSSNKPGSKPISKPSPSSSLGKRPRSTFATHDDSDSDSDAEGKRGKHEVVTAFGAGGAIREDDKRKDEGERLLVIPRLGNRDWRGEGRARVGRKNLLPAEVQAQREEEREGGAGEKARREGIDVVNSGDGEIVWGLSVRKKEDTSKRLPDSEDKGEEKNGKVQEEEEEEETRPQTADEEALEALLGNRKERTGPDLVIPAAAEIQEGPISETDAYRRAIASAPDASTLEDYERVPVEEFGAAMLRGMGWKGPSADAKTGVKEVKRRQNLLGLGAKELKDAEELGAWVQKSDTKRLNGGGDRRPERRPRVSEYKREKERRDERREERGGGSYRRERERDGGRDYRDRDRERDRDRDRRR